MQGEYTHETVCQVYYYRCSQPLADSEITKLKLENRKLERELAVTSGG